MKVLIACEFSGTVRDAFAKAGHYSVGCDLLESESPIDGMYYQGDVFDIIKYWKWDLIIAHPPCTYMCVAGNRSYANTDLRENAIEWTNTLWSECLKYSERVCFENPVGVLTIPNIKPIYIQPYQFGHMETKKTGLWLYNLPKLQETNNVREQMILLPEKVRNRIHHMAPSKDRGKKRSVFYSGIADAMVEQWGNLTCKQ